MQCDVAFGRQVGAVWRYEAGGRDDFAQHGVVEGGVQAQDFAEEGVVEGHLFCLGGWGGEGLRGFGAQGCEG